MENVTPIKPDQVQELKDKTIPSWVIQGFNNVIARNWSGSSSKFTQDEAMAEVISIVKTINPSITRQVIYANHWFDVETLYRDEGWIVEYDKPAYCETYKATFAFRRT